MEHIRVTIFLKEIKLDGVRSRLEAQKKKEKKKMFLKKISETN